MTSPFTSTDISTQLVKFEPFKDMAGQGFNVGVLMYMESIIAENAVFEADRTGRPHPGETRREALDSISGVRIQQLNLVDMYAHVKDDMQNVPEDVRQNVVGRLVTTIAQLETLTQRATAEVKDPRNKDYQIEDYFKINGNITDGLVHVMEAVQALHMEGIPNAADKALKWAPISMKPFYNEAVAKVEARSQSQDMGLVYVSELKVA